MQKNGSTLTVRSSSDHFHLIKFKFGLVGWTRNWVGRTRTSLNGQVSGEGAILRLVAYGHIRIIIIRVHIITRNSRHLNHEHYPLDLKTLKVTLTNHKILKSSLKTKKKP